LWKATWLPWFPDGLDDPDLCAVEVELDTVEIWDSSGVKGMRTALSLVRAAVSGERATPPPGTYEEIRLREPR
jgi:hypothetical protein